MALVEILANGQRTGIIVDQAALQAAHDAWYANPANTKCWRCSFAAPQHAPSCPNANRQPCRYCDHLQHDHNPCCDQPNRNTGYLAPTYCPCARYEAART